MLDPEVTAALVDYTGCGLNRLFLWCMFFQLKIIVLSGGIAEAGETYIEQIRRAYAKHTWTKFPNPVRPLNPWIYRPTVSLTCVLRAKLTRSALRRRARGTIPV
jgi:hypothetical protein